MAFRHTEFGALVSADPAKARDRLIKLYAKPRTGPEVAAKLGVGWSTLKRWLLALDRAGFPVSPADRCKTRPGRALGTISQKRD